MVARKAKRHIVPRREKTHLALFRAKSNDEFLLRKALQKPKASGRHLLIQDLVYNMSDSLRELAYRSGFNLGARAYENSDGSVRALENLLENAGLGKLAYTPYETKSLFTSYGIRSKGVALGRSMHAFESGIIAGYLSSQMNKFVYVSETACAFNGSPYCQFAAEGSLSRSSSAETINFDKAVGAVRAALAAEAMAVDDSYYVLSLRPLLKGQLHEEAAKLLYMIGRHLASRGAMPDTVSNVAARLAAYVGASKVSVAHDKEGVTVILAFSHSSSIRSLVDLAVSAVSGYVHGTYGYDAHVAISLNSNKTYRATISAGSHMNEKKRVA